MALSGGERRRCEIARALAAKPSIMLLDEPFAGIDPLSIADIRDLVMPPEGPRHRRPDHRPQRARDARHRRPRLHHLRRPGAVRRQPQELVADATVRAVYLGEAFQPLDVMALGPRLDLRQSQSLVMTPQLQQAIKLLALSNLELETFVDSELEKNPLLEAAGEERRRRPPTRRVEAADDCAGDELARPDELIAAGGGEIDAPLDVDHGAETFHRDCASDSRRRRLAASTAASRHRRVGRRRRAATTTATASRRR